MAQVDIENTAPTAAPPMKKRVGRPPKAPQDGRGPEIILDPPGAPDYFTQTRNYSKDDWAERYFQYLYRTAPITDRSATGQAKHIEKFTQYVDPDEIMKQHGSGGYKFVLNEFDPTRPANQQYRIVRSAFFHILNPNYPPKVPLGDWIDDPRNNEWLWAKPALIAAAANGAAGVPTGMSGSDAVHMFQTAVQAVTTLRPPEEAGGSGFNKLLLEMMENARKANDPTLLFTLLKDLMQKPQGTDPMVLLMMARMEAAEKELAAERAFARELLLKQTNAQGGLKDVLVLAQTLKEASGLFRGTPAKQGTDWGDIVEKVLVKAVEVSPGFMAQMMNPRQPAAAGPRPINQQTIDTTAQNGEPRAPQTEEEIQAMFAQINQFFGAQLDAVTPFLVDQFKRGLTGMDFRDWYLQKYGDNGYEQLAQLDEKTIIGVLEYRRKMQGVQPEIQNMLAQLAPPEKFLKFIQEFKSDEGLDDDGEPAAPAETDTTKGPALVERDTKPFVDPNNGGGF